MTTMRSTPQSCGSSRCYEDCCATITYGEGIPWPDNGRLCYSIYESFWLPKKLCLQLSRRVSYSPASLQTSSEDAVVSSLPNNEWGVAMWIVPATAGIGGSMAKHDNVRQHRRPASQRFRDRSAAGRALAQALHRYAGRPDVVVLGLPRGGVPVAAAVAEQLGVPLDITIVRKLGTPGQVELAMGAIADDGTCILNADVVEHLRIPETVVDSVMIQEQAELKRRLHAYRKGHAPLNLQGKTVIIIDDGLVTGSTMRAAVAAVRAQQPCQVVVAVPVASQAGLTALRPLVDELVWLIAPSDFYALSLWYEDFRQLGDDEVRGLLR